MCTHTWLIKEREKTSPPTALVSKVQNCKNCECRSVTSLRLRDEKEKKREEKEFGWIHSGTFTSPPKPCVFSRAHGIRRPGLIHGSWRRSTFSSALGFSAINNHASDSLRSFVSVLHRNVAVELSYLIGQGGLALLQEVEVQRSSLGFRLAV